MSTEVKTLQIGRKEMDYFRFGKEDGEKLVILPGLSLKSVMGAADAIVNAYALLAEAYDIYMLDRIRVFPQGYNIEAMADDTLAALRQLNLDAVHLMGVSQGGMIAQVIALKSPGTVKSLVLCSTASRIPEGSRAVFKAWYELAEERDLPALMAAFGEKVYTPSFYEMYKDIIIASGNGASEQDFANFLISLEGTEDFDVFAKLKEIRCPVFVLGAGKDQVLGADSSREIAAQLGCQSYIYEDYGHGVYDEAPDYQSRIREFL